MGTALTIGIMFVVFGVIMYIRDNGPYTVLDEIDPTMFVGFGVAVLINCLAHYLII